MWKQAKVGVLVGGLSAEREISILSGNAIIHALRESGYDVCSLDVGKDAAQRIAEERIEVAFVALHGRWGEDGTIQGMLEIMRIPYTGSGVLASALAMNKPMTKRVIGLQNLPTPRFQVVDQKEVSEGGRKGKIRLRLGFPVVVKPVSEGSTIGVSLVEDKEGLAKAVEEAGKFTGQVMIEEFIDGTEVAVGVLNGRSLPVIEIVPMGRLYDYRSKYTRGMTEYVFPARLTKDQSCRVQDFGVRVYEAIGCHGAARVDMILDVRGVPSILEINTIPGMTSTSLLPKAAGHVGLNFGSLVEEILKSAKLHT